MKVKKFALTAILLTVVLVFSSCGKIVLDVEIEDLSGFGNMVNYFASKASNAATPNNNSVTAAPVSEENSSAPEKNENPTSSVTENSSPAVNQEKPTQAAASSVPTGKDEIINYYVAAYNKIASNAKKATRTYDYTSNYNNIVKANNNSTLESLAQSLMTKFMVENKDSVDFDVTAVPPIGVANLNISPSQISKATLTDKGTYYEVTLYSTGTDDNYEADCDYGSGSAGVIGPLLRTDEVTGAVKGILTFEGLHAYYATAKVIANIDKATGHITEFKFETPCVLHFDAVKIILVTVKNCDIGLLFQQNWSISY